MILLSANNTKGSNMNTLIALVFTYSISGQVYQEIPESFYSMEDCVDVIVENKLGNQFQCVIVNQ